MSPDLVGLGARHHASQTGAPQWMSHSCGVKTVQEPVTHMHSQNPEQEQPEQHVYTMFIAAHSPSLNILFLCCNASLTFYSPVKLTIRHLGAQVELCYISTMKN